MVKNTDITNHTMVGTSVAIDISDKHWPNRFGYVAITTFPGIPLPIHENPPDISIPGNNPMLSGIRRQHRV